jgi:hypothetical protein
LLEFVVLGLNPVQSVCWSNIVYWATFMVGLLSVYLGIAWVSVPVFKSLQMVSEYENLHLRVYVTL